MEYLDDVLRLAATRADYRPAGWTDETLITYRRLIQCALAAVDDRDIRAMRSLRLRLAETEPTGAWSVHLDSQRRIALRFKPDGNGTTAILELLNSKADLR